MLDTNGSAILPVTIVIVAVGAFAAIIIVATKRAKRRREAITALATQMGFSYLQRSNSFLQDLQFGSTLFPTKDNRSAENLIVGTMSGLQSSIFDFTYEEADNNPEAPGNVTKRRTVTAFASSQHRLPSFELTKKGLFSGLTKHVKFESNPEFAERFKVTGSDLEAVKRAFNPQVMNVLSSTHPDERLHLKGEGQWLVFWAQKGLKAEDWRGFLEDKSRLASDFFRSAGST